MEIHNFRKEIEPAYNNLCCEMFHKYKKILTKHGDLGELDIFLPLSKAKLTLIEEEHSVHDNAWSPLEVCDPNRFFISRINIDYITNVDHVDQYVLSDFRFKKDGQDLFFNKTKKLKEILELGIVQTYNGIFSFKDLVFLGTSLFDVLH